MIGKQVTAEISFIRLVSHIDHQLEIIAQFLTL